MHRLETCPNCGTTDNYNDEEVYIDRLGMHTICRECGSSFNIWNRLKDFELAIQYLKVASNIINEMLGNDDSVSIIWEEEVEYDVVTVEEFLQNF